MTPGSPPTKAIRTAGLGQDGTVTERAEPSTRDRLIAAARDEFLEHGYQATSVARVARRAGLTTGAIYSNFSSKAALLAEAIVLEGRALWGAGLAQASEAGDPLQRAVIIYTNVISGNPQSVDRLVLEGWVGALHDPETHEQVMRNLDAIAATIRSQIAAPGVDDATTAATDETDAVIAILEAIALGGLVRRALGRQRPPVDAVEEILRRSFAGLSPRDSGTTTEH